MADEDKDRKMTKKEHQERHELLHKHLDELLADYMRHTKGSVLDRPIVDLVTWSHEQTVDPMDPR